MSKDKEKDKKDDLHQYKVKYNDPVFDEPVTDGVPVRLKIMRSFMKKHNVCVDLDGVLAQYKGWQGVDQIGDPIPGAVEFCNRLAEEYNIIIYTARCNSNVKGRPEDFTPDLAAGIVRRWLDKHGFNYTEVFTGQGKPIASAYVDDRAVSCRPQDLQDKTSVELEFQEALDDVDYLCGYTATKEKDI